MQRVQKKIVSVSALFFLSCLLFGNSNAAELVISKKSTEPNIVFLFNQSTNTHATPSTANRHHIHWSTKDITQGKASREFFPYFSSNRKSNQSINTVIGSLMVFSMLRKNHYLVV